MKKNTSISVFYRQQEVGKVDYDLNLQKSYFQYHPDFLNKTPILNLFPYIFRKITQTQVFTGYEGETFRGLPPMIADSLPDFFGNILFQEYLKYKGLNKLTPTEQLTYVGNRGMGALEYIPSKTLDDDFSIDFDELIEVTHQIMDAKKSIHEKGINHKALMNIFKIGSSVGGARPKILIAENKNTKEIIPGDITILPNYTHYLVKLDMGDSPYSKEKIEYIYYLLAKDLGIEIMPSKLIDDKHFATERFDRQEGKKIHTLTATGITGWDFKNPEHSSYENLFRLALDLSLPQKDIKQLYQRMVFNVVFANTDDHLKNFSFSFNDVSNSWRLAPAYDLTYPLNALMNYVRISRALSINGKRVDITTTDVLKIANNFSIKNAENILQKTIEMTDKFMLYCDEYNISKMIAQEIFKSFKKSEGLN